MRKKEKKKALEWREARKQDELRFGDQVSATLRWQGWTSTLAYGRTAAGRWTFGRPKLLSKEVEVRIPEGEEPMAVFWPCFLGDGGELGMADGRTFRWYATDFLATRWVFAGTDGDELVRFTDTSGLLERRAIVSYGIRDLSETDRGLLVLLGRYLMVLHTRDTAAITAATTAAIC